MFNKRIYMAYLAYRKVPACKLQRIKEIYELDKRVNRVQAQEIQYLELTLDLKRELTLSPWISKETSSLVHNIGRTRRGRVCALSYMDTTK